MRVHRTSGLVSHATTTGNSDRRTSTAIVDDARVSTLYITVRPTLCVLLVERDKPTHERTRNRRQLGHRRSRVDVDMLSNSTAHTGLHHTAHTIRPAI